MRFLRAAFSRMVGAEKQSQWIELSLIGEYLGHQDGEFEITPTTFDQIIANFDRQKNPVVLDYEHSSVYSGGEAAPAAGWITRLEKRPGASGKEALFAFVEFTPRGASYVNGDEYKFCSAVIDFDAEDRVTGEPIGAYLHSAGMTNTPFVDGMTPIQRMAAKRRIQMAFDVKSLAKLLGQIPEDASKDQILAVVNAELAKQEAMTGPPKAEDKPAEEAPKEMAASAEASPMAAADVPPPVEDAAMPMAEGAPGAPPSDAPDAGAAVVALLGEILKTDAAGVLAFVQAHRAEFESFVQAEASEDAGGAPMAAALKALKDIVSAQGAELVALKGAATKKNEDEKAARAKAFDAQVDADVAAGKILPAARASYRELAEKSPAIYADLVSKQQAVITERVVPEEAAAGNGGPAEADLVAKFDEGLVAAGAFKNNPEKRLEHARKQAAEFRATKIG